MTKLFSALLLLSATAAQAENVPAKNCELFIERMYASWSSHNSGGMHAQIKVRWLGGGEFIQRVGFYQHTYSIDHGNQSSCTWGKQPDGSTWSIEEGREQAPGVYDFAFPIHTGAVVSACNGYSYSHVGSFFVETNKNTYWINPDMDPAKYFTFDPNGFNVIMNKAGWSSGVATDRDDMKYYNPLVCR